MEDGKMAEVRDYTVTSSELDFSDFFESEPEEAIPRDGYWCYKFKDQHEVELRLSFNILEKSVQTVLLVCGEEVETVVLEGAAELKIRENELHGRFDLGRDTRLVILLRPRIVVRWYSLQKS
jgi:hypothetical protein